MRSSKVLRNGMWGVLLQVITTVLGFVGRTVFIKCLCAEYLGISGLFSNVLAVFSLSELGFSSSVSYHLYRHLVIGDQKRIAAIMEFYRGVYLKIAGCILLLGCALLPFLHHIIGESSFELNYIRLVYILFVIKTVTTYLFSYNFTLVMADQKQYLLTRMDIIFHIIMSLANIVILVLFRNYVLYLIEEILISVLANWIKTVMVRKEYPYIVNSQEKLSKEEKNAIWHDVKNIFVGKVSTVIVTSTDNILISAIINVTMVGLYSNYSMIINYVQNFLVQFTTATRASLGNMLAQESKEYSYKTMKRLTTILYFVTSFCAVSLFVLFNPFITIWVGEEYLLGMPIVALCVINFYIQIIKTPLWFAITGLGYFKEDRNIAIYGALSNLLVSIAAAKLWGLFGIFLGTAFSQLTQWMMKVNLFCGKYMQMKANDYLLHIVRLFGYTAVLICMTQVCCNFVSIENLYADLFVKACICAVIPNVSNYLLFRKTDEMAYLKQTLSGILRKKHG